MEDEQESNQHRGVLDDGEPYRAMSKLLNGEEGEPGESEGNLLLRILYGVFTGIVAFVLVNLIKLLDLLHRVM